MSKFRINYTITESDDGFETEREVGFGSSGSWCDIDACLNMVEADIENGCWETSFSAPTGEQSRGKKQ